MVILIELIYYTFVEDFYKKGYGVIMAEMQVLSKKRFIEILEEFEHGTEEFEEKGIFVSHSDKYDQPHLVFKFVKFEFMELSMARLANVDFVLCEFLHVRVFYTAMRHCKFRNCTFHNVEFRDVDFYDDCSFKESIITRSEIKLTLRESEIYNAIIKESDVIVDSVTGTIAGMDAELSTISITLKSLNLINSWFDRCKLKIYAASDDHKKYEVEFREIDVQASEFEIEGQNIYGWSRTHFKIHNFILSGCKVNSISLKISPTDEEEYENARDIIQQVNCSYNYYPYPLKAINVGPIGSRGDYTTYYPIKNIVKCGCWKDDRVHKYCLGGNPTGTLEEFEERVKERYGEYSDDVYDINYYQEYMNVIAYFKSERKRYLDSLKKTEED